MTKLANFSFFSHLSDTAQAEVFAKMHTVEVPKGEKVITEGDVSTCFYLLQAGQVEVYISGQDGQRFQLNTLGAGSHFGELSFIGGEKRSASVSAIADCRFLVLDQESFRNILNTRPELYEHLVKSLTTLIHKQNAIIRDLTMNESYLQIRKHLNQSHSEMSSFRKAPPAMTVESIGAATDIDKVIVLRTLERLAEQKYLTINAGKVTVFRTLPAQL